MFTRSNRKQETKINTLEVFAVGDLPIFKKGDDLCSAILASPNLDLRKGDIVCVASKVVSLTEGRTVSLADVVPGEVAHRIHQAVPRKDPRVVQVMLEETGDPSGSRLEIDGNFIGGWLPNGVFATSAGVDRIDETTVALLPKYPDVSVARLGKAIQKHTGLQVGVIITDSDGRKDKRGATQIAIGVYGVPPLRVSTSTTPEGQEIRSEETACDMLAATAGLLMGQRGTQVPVTVIRGFEFEFSIEASIKQATTRQLLD